MGTCQRSEIEIYISIVDQSYKICEIIFSKILLIFESFTKVLLLSNNSSNIAYVVKLSKINNIFEKNISHIL